MVSARWAFEWVENRVKTIVPGNYLDGVYIKMHMAALQEIIMELGNKGLVQYARRIISERLVPFEQQYGRLYLQ